MKIDLAKGMVDLEPGTVGPTLSTCAQELAFLEWSSATFRNAINPNASTPAEHQDNELKALLSETYQRARVFMSHAIFLLIKEYIASGKSTEVDIVSPTDFANKVLEEKDKAVPESNVVPLTKKGLN